MEAHGADSRTTCRKTAPSGCSRRAIGVPGPEARLGCDTFRGYTGFIVKREGRRLLVGGDTAHSGAFDAHRPFGPVDASLTPIGAPDPWIHAHCTPEQAMAMADAAGARLFVPLHHPSFRSSRELFDEPIRRAEHALREERDRLGLREAGQTVVIDS